MNITVKAHFNKQTKDSKKELVQFYVTGEDEKRPELNQLTREVVILEIADLDVELTICESQLSLDEFREEQEEYCEGLKGKINKDAQSMLNQTKIKWL